MRTFCDASRYPSAPGWIFALRLCCVSGGSQPISSSRPTSDQQRRAVQLQNEARLRLDEMRVLIPAGDRLDLDLVAADLLHDRGEILGGGDDVDGRRGARRASPTIASARRPRCGASVMCFSMMQASESVRAVRADGEEELEEELVGRDCLRRTSSGGTALASG